jgi:mono/diheme cytochrome c family protein
MGMQTFRPGSAFLSLVVIWWIASPILVEAAEEPRPAPSVKTGERLFLQSCASCHDAHSQNRVVGPGLKGYYTSHFSAAKDETIRDIILHGRGTMPAFSTFNRSEIDDLIAYLRTL